MSMSVLSRDLLYTRLPGNKISRGRQSHALIHRLAPHPNRSDDQPGTTEACQKGTFVSGPDNQPEPVDFNEGEPVE